MSPKKSKLLVEGLIEVRRLCRATVNNLKTSAYTNNSIYAIMAKKMTWKNPYLLKSASIETIL